MHCDAKKTLVQAFNQDEPVLIKSREGIILKEVKYFKYLGAWMESSDMDISVRKALAWNACYKLCKIWSSKISKKIKTGLNAYNVSWEDHMTNETLYNKLPAISLKIQRRRMRLAGH